MLLNFENESLFDSDKLKKSLNTLFSPAFLLDNELRITAMNTEAKIMLFNLAEGDDILPYIPESVAESIAQMMSGEVCSVDFTCGVFNGSANVISGNGEKLLILATMPYSLGAALSTVSGYGQNKKEPDFLENIASELRKEHFTPRLLPFFECSSVLNAFKRELFAIFPETAKSIILHGGDKLFAKGSERDFALIVAELAFICICAANGTPVDIFAECEREELVLSVSCTPSNHAPQALAGIEQLALLASGNLWGLDITEQTENRLAFSLRMPFVKSGEEFLVRDVSAEFLRSLVARIFLRIQK